MDSCQHCAGSGEPVPEQVDGCRVLREFTLLQEVSTVLAQGFELRDAMQRLFRKLSLMTGLQRGLLTVVNREVGILTIAERAELGSGGPEVLGGAGEGIFGAVIKNASPMLIENLALVRTEAFTDDELKLLRSAIQAGESIVVVPIRHGHEVLGTLSFTRKSGSIQNHATDIGFLTLVAGQVGLAVRFRQLAKERIDALREQNEKLQEQIRKSFIPNDMVGRSSAMRSVYFHVDQVAEGKTTVLIRGETGVGKERIAHAIVDASTRKKGSYVRVNCAALPESIIESELFGHEKGAFTGALSLRKGRFELAHKGTIFLDEIGEVSLSTQAKLLRVLQEGTFERVGGHETLTVDVRVITATNRNLEKMIEDGKFRQDLYYRINVFPIYVPPLRERKSDILELADYFLEKYAKQNGKRVVRLSTPAIDMLMAYHWPGNVRELENVIERATLLSSDGVIHAFHMPPSLQTAKESDTEIHEGLEEAVAALERELIVEALKADNGIVSKAARRLRLTGRMLRLRIEKLAIDPDRFKTEK